MSETSSLNRSNVASDKPPFRVNEDGSVPDDVLRAYYTDAWEPDYVSVVQVRELLDIKDDSKHSVIMSQILSMLKSFRIGADLTRAKNPMISQNPKSTLDMLADIQSPIPDLLTVHQEPDPIKRMMACFSQGLQGLTFSRFKGLTNASPYNPILREQFHCKWEHSDSTTYFAAEQVSHHPPISCTMTWNENARMMSWGTNCLSLVFRGNSADLAMKGEHGFVVFVQDEQTGEIVRESYDIVVPSISLSGLFIGTARMDVAAQKYEITCERTGLKVSVKFKRGGNFKGYVYRNGVGVRKLKGSLSGECRMINLEQHPESNDWDKHGVVFFDTSTTMATVHMKTVRPVEEMLPVESRRVWFAPTYAIRKMRDLEAAADFKNRVEEHQRFLRKQEGFSADPVLFLPTRVKKDGIMLHRHKDYDVIEQRCFAGGGEGAAGARSSDVDGDLSDDLD